ncbi:MAG: hypothetical protein ACK5QX_09235 [bacterium]
MVPHPVRATQPIPPGNRVERCSNPSATAWMTSDAGELGLPLPVTGARHLTRQTGAVSHQTHCTGAVAPVARVS